MKPFKPYLVDIWSNNRYGDKAQAKNSGQVITVKITENISENLICDILNAAAKAHLNQEHNTQNTSEFDYAFGYEIHEMELKYFLVPFYHSLLQESKPQFYRYVIVKAIDLEEASIKANTVRMQNSTGESDRFDPNMIEEVSEEHYQFLMKSKTFICFVYQ